MIYGYIRVSTDKQNTENQKFEINKFSCNNNFVIDEWIEETISATRDLKERKLGKLISKVKKNDIIITSELSRLGRNLLQIMSILHHCMNIGVKIFTIKDNYCLGSDIQSKVLAFAFGLSAEIERNLISQRTKEALAARRAAGIVLGRPKGRKNTILKLTDKENTIKRLLNEGHTKSAIAKKLNVHRNTLSCFLKK